MVLKCRVNAVSIRRCIRGAGVSDGVEYYVGSLNAPRGGAAHGCQYLQRILVRKESKKGSRRPLAGVLETVRARPSPGYRIFPALVPSATLRPPVSPQTQSDRRGPFLGRPQLVASLSLLP